MRSTFPSSLALAKKGESLEKTGELFEGVMGMAFMGLIILIGIGDLYWLWMSIQLGSFMMFVAGLFPLFFIVTGPIGAWSLLFGVPDWVANMFWVIMVREYY